MTSLRRRIAAKILRNWRRATSRMSLWFGMLGGAMGAVDAIDWWFQGDSSIERLVFVFLLIGARYWARDIERKSFKAGRKFEDDVAHGRRDPEVREGE